ncbi:MAG TPA: FAD-dependent oxidoreductase [Burkholderiales bacterium]|nr:FAD-dependent oxidoreductase [Burkholderiales bacterium]
MASYETRLKRAETIAEGTMAFHLEKPPGFRFKAGQAIDLALANPPLGANSTHRLFSLVSAPFEEEMCVATRMRDGSAYKSALKALAPGATLKVKGPLGVMTLHEDRSRAAVFIAGGIGITPFISMLRHAAHEGLDRPLYLLYSNRRPDYAAFLAELQALAQRHARFRLLARMTDAEGFIDADTVRRFAGDAAAPVYYLAGPPAMVDAMTGVLARAGVNEADINSEEFYGY